MGTLLSYFREISSPDSIELPRRADEENLSILVEFDRDRALDRKSVV